MPCVNVVQWYYNIMADQGGDAAWQHNVLHLLQRCNTAAAAEPPAPAAGSSSSAAAVTLDDETCQNLSEVFKKGFALLTELQQHNVSEGVNVSVSVIYICCQDDESAMLVMIYVS